MTTFLAAFSVFLAGLRIVLFWAAVVIAVLATLSWLVRTRRISPFGPAARFVRQTTDPIFAPMERALVRAGGLPTNAPWWTLAVLIVGGLLLLSLLGFVQGFVVSAMMSAASGPAGMLRMLVSLTFSVLRVALMVRVLSSWVRVSPYSPWVRWAFALSEPILRPLRQVIPSLGMIDITPIIAYFVLGLLEGALLRLI